MERFLMKKSKFFLSSQRVTACLWIFQLYSELTAKPMRVKSAVYMKLFSCK